MEKASNTENEVAALADRWQTAKKVSEEHVVKVRKERKACVHAAFKSKVMYRKGMETRVVIHIKK